MTKCRPTTQKERKLEMQLVSVVKCSYT